MTVSDQGKPAGRKRGVRRRFQILIGAVIAIALLWTGGWFAARHYVAGKIAAIEARAADEGATLSCGEQTISGFPFRLGVTCTPIAASCPAEEASLDLAGLEAIGLVYNPGHALFAAKAPLALKGPNGLTADATWKSLESSVHIGFSGLKRYSLVADGLDGKLVAPERLAGPIAVTADHAELHLVPDPDSAALIDVFATVTNGTAVVPGRPSVPPVTTDIEVDLPRAMLARGGDAIPLWIQSGEPVRVRRIELDLAGFSAALAGDATIDADGLLSGVFTVRLTALDRLPALAESLHPGAGKRVAQLIAPLSMMLRPVSADGRDWREAKVMVQRGRASMGILPLGQIPSLLRGAAPASPPPVAVPAAPAPAPETASAPPPAAENAPAVVAEAPAAPAPSVAPAAPGGAADAIRDLVNAAKQPGRCAIVPTS